MILEQNEGGNTSQPVSKVQQQIDQINKELQEESGYQELDHEEDISSKEYEEEQEHTENDGEQENMESQQFDHQHYESELQHKGYTGREIQREGDEIPTFNSHQEHQYDINLKTGTFDISKDDQHEEQASDEASLVYGKNQLEEPGKMIY